MLDNPNEPVSDLSYFDCIESVMENSKVDRAIRKTHTHRCRAQHPEHPLFRLSFSPLVLRPDPGRVHGRYFSELQDWGRVFVWRLRRLGVEGSVWPH